MKPLIAPALMCIDYTHIAEQIQVMNQYVDLYHIDIMDSVFVKNLGWFPDMIRQLRPLTDLPLDCHLMTGDFSLWLPAILDSGADIVSVHAEAITTCAFRVFDQIKQAGRKVGIVINPATSLSVIESYIGQIDELTLMTIEPGFPGARFIPEMIEKIRAAAELRERLGLHFIIGMDGSCSPDNFQTLRDAGTDMFVTGAAALFNLDKDLESACQKMYHNFNLQ